MDSDFDTEPSEMSTSCVKLEADETMENICLPLLRKKNPKLKYLNPKMRNAGRKKSNPAWEYFEDLRPGGILQGVRCRHCDFYSEDRSPTMMKYHIKRKHDTGAGGLWEMLNECYDRLGSHKYIPKKRAKILSAVLDGIQHANEDENNLDWEEEEEEENLAGFPSANDAELHEESDGPSSVHSLSIYEGTDGDGIVADSSAASQLLQSNNGTESGMECSAEMVTNILQFAAVEDPSSYKSSLPKVEMWNRAMDLSQKTRPRNANNWTYLATFENEDEMHQVRIREKVSKRREEMLKNGRKVRYRCNKWKSTKCGFQMFALFANDKIDLYETGVHDHTGDRIRNHIEKMRNKGVIVAPPGPRQPSQSQILRRLLKQSVNQKRHQVITITAYNGDKDVGLDDGENATVSGTSSIPQQQTNEKNGNTEVISTRLAKRTRKLVQPSKIGTASSAYHHRILTADESEKSALGDDEPPMSSDETTDFDHVLQGMGWISGNKNTSFDAETRTRNFANNSSGYSNSNHSVITPESLEDTTKQNGRKRKLAVKQESRQTNRNEQSQKYTEKIDNNEACSKQQENQKNREDNAIQQFLKCNNGFSSHFNAESFATFCAAVTAAEASQSSFTTNFDKIAAAMAAAIANPDLKYDILAKDLLEAVGITPSHHQSSPAPTTLAAVPAASFTLADMTRVSELVEIASDLELDLKLCPPGSGTVIEYIFCPKKTSVDRSVSISEDLAQTNPLDQVVVVRDLVNGTTVREETWSKSSWSLFHWAIRGKCSHFFAEKKRKK